MFQCGSVDCKAGKYWLKMNARDPKSVTVKSKSSFYYSFFFLPKEKREAMYSIYAFCRRSDDIVDQCTSTPVRKKELDCWRKEVQDCCSGTVHGPVMRALGETVSTYDIPEVLLQELIDGVEMDLYKDRYETFEQLYGYCYKVASVVGLMCIKIFGYSSPLTEKYAESLGIAFQLTNIIRDIGVDADLGRIYLPAEYLERFGVPEEDLLHRKYSMRFVRMMREFGLKAEHYYRFAEDMLPAADRSRMLPAHVMAGIYRRLLDRVAERRWNVLGERVALSTAEKVVVAVGVAVRRLFSE